MIYVEFVNFMIFLSIDLTSDYILRVYWLQDKFKFLMDWKSPDFQFPDYRKVGNLKFWVENQGQWPKLSGKNSPYFEIGQN